MNELVALVERQREYLARQQGERFVLSVPGFLAALEGEPRIAAVLDDLRASASEALASYGEADGRAVDEARELRIRLSSLVPEVDATGGGGSRVELTLAEFERTASTKTDIRFPREPELPIEDPGSGAAMLECLSEATRALRFGADPNVDARPDLEHLTRDIGNVVRAHEAALNRFKLAARTHAGLALHRLEWVCLMLDEEPEILPYGEEALLRRAERMMLRVGSDESLLRKLAAGEMVADGLGASSDQLDRIVRHLKVEAEALCHELEHRLDVRLSHEGIMRRFKARCELHDRRRLASLADDAQTPEHDLRDELTRYLFDQGLNPLSEATLGDHRPDVLAVSGSRPTFYVEAKQYSTGPKALAMKALAQVVSTAGTLSGPPFEIREAWLVIFRRGGRDLVLPSQVRVGGLTVHCLVVDVGEPSGKGSQRRWGPVVLSAEELVAGLPAPPPDDASS